MILKNLGKIFIFVIFIQTLLFAKYQFTQTLSKDSIYLNETIKVTLILQFENNNSELIDLVDFEEFDTSDFWITLYKNQTKKLKNNIWTYKYEYLLEPKNIGSFTLPKQLIKVSSYQIRKEKKFLRVYSKPRVVKVLPLVQDLNIIGDFNITLEVDKKIVNANESIKAKLLIDGKGNLQDIKKYDLALDQQTVYNDDIKVQSEFKNKWFEGNATQEFLIIANSSFTLPSLTLEYYNPSLQKIEKKITNPIFIEVQNEEKQNKDEVWVKYLFMFMGIIMGVIGFVVFKKIQKSFHIKDKTLYRKIQMTTNKQQLYQILIQNNFDKKFNEIVDELENDIYKNQSTKKFKELKKIALARIFQDSLSLP
jgi:hypothetical protein